MLDDLAQKDLASRMGRVLAGKGVRVVFVGSTAVVGLGLYPRTSKDADALAEPTLSLEEARRVMQEVADDEELAFQEKGWGTLAVVKPGPDGETPLWEVDLIVPDAEVGMIPPAVARRVHQRAVETAIGRTAIAEHVLAMKAIAYGDCVGKAEMERAARYESDLFQFRDVVADDFDWDEVKRLLADFQDARRLAAAEKLHEVLGRDVGLPVDTDVAFG